jgi:hypothetical protein
MNNYPIGLPDAHTRTCIACGHAYQADDYDDPSSGGPLWEQATGPCCFHGPARAPKQVSQVAPAFRSIPPWVPHTATQKTEARWNLKALRDRYRANP